MGTARLLALLLVLPISGPAADLTRTIHNPFGDQWPLEHVWFDLDPSEAREPLTCTIRGVTRPTQLERVTVGGRERARLWTVATIVGKDAGGDVPALLRPGNAPSALSVREEGEFYVVANGVFEARIRRYAGALAQPTPLERVPHWLGGVCVAGQDRWDARARFEGPPLIRAARTEIVARGPVHVDLLITLAGAEPEGTTEAVPLTSGKQSFLFPPDAIPRETVPRRTHHYQARVRIVLDDPWIDVAERAHFPRDPAIQPWGFSQHVIDFGGAQGLALDTAMWVRWFEWDKFGGNVDLLFHPARQREMQKGKPFAMLRPIWNQGGGGAQDFFLTSGGDKPADREVPAVGVVAAFPSKWVGPFAQTIVARAEGGNSGSLRMPLVPADVPGLWYGQRAYGLCAGPRRLFDTTGAMNSLVRRHTDWTLNALINRYVLRWPRDPAKAGPHLLLTRQRLEQLRAGYAAGARDGETAAIREEWARLQSVAAQVADLEKRAKTAPEAEAKEIKDQLGPLRRTLTSEDADVLALIVENKPKAVRVTDSWLWRDRRYQDDFLNPTSRPTRTLHDYRRVDLFAGGQPAGGPDVAALAYIVTDPDNWMGWRQGWMPGNPNFHTDKYASALYLAGTILDHPHAADWLAFARANFLDDLGRVLDAPDGVGVECPGYAGYALGMLLPMAQAFVNLGERGIVAGQPLLRGSGVWHRKLLTPVDPRLGRRHEAPIGDTHRWDAGLGEHFGDLGRLFAQSDPAFAAEMSATWRLLETGGTKAGRSRFTRLLAGPLPPPADLARLDWSSQPFHGFGAVLRTGFGTPRETFLSLKAGGVRGHYHNDENSFHYYAQATPVALDYNCSYHPRGDHAALHNTLTFGREATVTHNERNQPVPAAEQILASACVGAFVSQPAGDLVVAERHATAVTLSPLFPEDAEFSRDYPTRPVAPIVHRRLLLLVKHPPTSALTDYLVVRDETRSGERQQLNLHLLARELKADADRIEAVGQLGLDMAVFLARAPGAQVSARSWHYSDEWLDGRDEYKLRAGETLAQWDTRMRALAQANGVDHLPLPGWQPAYRDARRGETQPWLDQIAQTRGLALIPPVGWRAPWPYGEYQTWLRVETAGGEALLWVLCPYAKGSPAPRCERVGEHGVRVSVGAESEVVTLDSAAGATVRGTTILGPGRLPALGEMRDTPTPAVVVRG